jgi:hypothetical protein
MRLRLLALFSFLLLVQTSLARQSQATKGDVPETCPVSNASDHPLIPPWPYPKVPDVGGSWFGTDRLWIALSMDGTWRGYRQKMQWWRQGYDYRTEPEPKLKVTGKRLDAPAPPLMAKTNNVGGPIPSMMVGMNFPAPGCWEITGHYESDELTFVVWVAPSMSESERWTEEQQKDYLARAEGGDANAQMWLGAGYEQGWFGKTDFQEAFRWLSRAAAQGNPDAQVSLGQTYENGEGVKQDYAQAAHWYRKAADHVPDFGGAGQGRNNLGLLYMEGLGVPNDYIQAYMWFSLTSWDPNPNLSHAKDQLTPTQVSEAERMAEEWKSNHPEP